MDTIYFGIADGFVHEFLMNGKRLLKFTPQDVCPWTKSDFTSELASPGSPQGTAWLHYKDGWTAVGVSDYTGDSSENSRSIFIIDSEEATIDQVMAASLWHHQKFVNRVGPLNLVKVIDWNNKRIT